MGVEVSNEGHLRANRTPESVAGFGVAAASGSAASESQRSAQGTVTKTAIQRIIVSTVAFRTQYFFVNPNACRDIVNEVYLLRQRSPRVSPWVIASPATSDDVVSEFSEGNGTEVAAGGHCFSVPLLSQ